MITYRFYVDGACSGNHTGKLGSMGIGVVAKCSNGDQVFWREYSIPKGPGTNGRAELLAAREAMLLVKEEHRQTSSVIIYTDAQYVRGMMNDGWKAKENIELVAEVRKLKEEFRTLHVAWVRGHDKCVENNRADQLAVQASKVPYEEEEQKQQPQPPPSDMEQIYEEYCRVTVADQCCHCSHTKETFPSTVNVIQPRTIQEYQFRAQTGNFILVKTDPRDRIEYRCDDCGRHLRPEQLSQFLVRRKAP